MKLSGGKTSGWYAPRVGANRETKEFQVHIRSTSAQEYRTALREVLIDKAAGATGDELIEETEDKIVRAHVDGVKGLAYSNDTDPPVSVKIGQREVAPGAEIEVQNGDELVDALCSAGDAEIAWVILEDISRAVKSRAHLREGMVPS